MTAILLDTSALLAHFFDEPGGDEVARLMVESDYLLSVVSGVEMHGRLREMGVPPARAEAVVEEYAGAAVEVVGIDARVARRAWELRATAPARLPLADALIAACASVREARLVHRDSHFDCLALTLPHQIRLAPSR
ncbi:PIN domain-containing protein [Myxococcota bacterium]|nr:PIN domain-containing protein [Myxococcota bacterium]